MFVPESVSVPAPSLLSPPSSVPAGVPLTRFCAMVTFELAVLIVAPFACTLATERPAKKLVLLPSAWSVPPLKLKVLVPLPPEISATSNVPPLREYVPLPLAALPRVTEPALTNVPALCVNVPMPAEPMTTTSA